MKKTVLFLAVAIVWVFNVNAQVSFSSPTGGENWEYGSIHSIDINNSGADINSNCMVTIIWDGGSQNNPLEIFSLPSGITSFNWTVNPINYSPSNDYFFEIRDFDNDGSLIATSNTFTVSAASIVFRIDAPNLGNTWISGQNETIEWFSYQISNVKIEYNLDDGSGWQTIENSYAVNEGYNSYNWTIPGITGVNENSIIRISDATNATIYKESYEFTLTSSPLITITNPSSGDQWEIGTTHSIDFNFAGTNSVFAEIYLYDNSDSQIGYIGSATITNGANSFSWNINASFSPITNCHIEITYGGNVFRSENFDLLAAQPNVTQVSSPGVGGYYFNSQNLNINWGTIGGISNVKIEYNIGDGVWHQITASTPTNDGGNYYSWPISGITGTNPNSTIRVSDIEDASRFALSGTFTLAESSPVSFTTPTSSTQWAVSTIQNIVFEYTGTSNLNVEIQFFDNGNQIWIPSSDITLVPGTNQFAWNIDPSAGFNPTTNMVLKVVIGPYVYATSAEFELITSSTPTISTDLSSVVFPETTIGNVSYKGVQIAATGLTNDINISLATGTDFKLWDNINSVWVTNYSVSPNSGNVNLYENIEFTASSNGTSLDELIISSTGAQTVRVPLSADAITGINNIISNKINIFPNPNNGTFNMNFGTIPTNASICIYDMAGRVILKKELNGIYNNIQLENANRGVYFIRITNLNNTYTEKLIIK